MIEIIEIIDDADQDHELIRLLQGEFDVAVKPRAAVPSSPTPPPSPPPAVLLPPTPPPSPRLGVRLESDIERFEREWRSAAKRRRLIYDRMVSTSVF